MTSIKLINNNGIIIKNFGEVGKEYIEEVFNELPDSFREKEDIFNLLKVLM